MKLLCIRVGMIYISNYLTNGEGLQLGKEYTTKGEPFKGKSGELCYFIEELQEPKLCCRFTKVIDPVKEEVIWSKKEEFSLN